MTHRIDPTRDLVAEPQDRWPWLGLLLLLLLLIAIMALLVPGRTAVAPVATAPQPIVASVVNPEMGAFARYQQAQRAQVRMQLLGEHPELQAVTRWQAAALQRQVQLATQNPELSAFWYYRATH